jgi:NADH-quinone oxidoreductase subunit M
MADLNLFVIAAIALPLIGAVTTPLFGRPRKWALLISAATLICSLAAATPVLSHPGARLTLGFDSSNLLAVDLDQLAAVPVVLFAALVLCVLAAAPKSMFDARGYAGVLVLLSSTIAVYSASSPLVFFTAWTASVAPFVFGMWRRTPDQEGKRRTLPAYAMTGSCVLLGAGLVLNEVMPSAELWVFALLVLAALLRKGVFPFQTWVVAAFSDGPLLPVGLFVNAHFGALLIARVAIPQFPELSQSALPLISNLALISAVYAAFVGLGENNSRRLLALTMLSQASFILSGLESRTPEGIAGALTHWMVVSVAMTGLLIVYSALEARGVVSNESQFLGLAGRAPRLAVFFAICGLALVGLPGTLGFAAEDLLFHGALETHPLLGVALPLATALNAVNIFRLFSRLFMGRRTTAVPMFPDALPRERAVLAIFLLFLIAGGLLPGRLLPLRTGAAHELSTILTEGSARD